MNDNLVDLQIVQQTEVDMVTSLKMVLAVVADLIATNVKAALEEMIDMVITTDEEMTDTIINQISHRHL